MAYDKIDSISELFAKHSDALKKGDLLTIQQAANRLGVSKQRISQLLLTPDLHGLRIMGEGFGMNRWFVWRSSVEKRLKGGHGR